MNKRFSALSNGGVGGNARQDNASELNATECCYRVGEIQLLEMA